MPAKWQEDFWSAIVFIAIGLAFASGSLQYKFGNSVNPGPGYFPFGLGIILALIGGLILVRSLVSRVVSNEPSGAIAWKPFVIITCAVILVGITLPWLGMFIALPILVLTAALAGDGFQPIEALVTAAILTIGSWAIFGKGLGLTIPLLPTFAG